MTAAQPQVPVTERVPSLEARWILPGQLEAPVTGWFARFPAEVESREDIYLVDPQLRGLSVKLRQGRTLEVKVYQGSPGILEVAGRARGRLESWDKWSFPSDLASPGSAGLPGWRPVRKLIRRFPAANGQPGHPLRGGDAGCEVELTEVRAGGRAWWTLGFEATGPAGGLRTELEAAAALVFTQALPGGVELRTDDSQSYMQWLTGAPAPGDPGA